MIRHGETEWSRSGAHTGRSDIRSAPPAAKCLRRGPLPGRTAIRPGVNQPTGARPRNCRLAGYGGDARIEDNLREWDYGDYEGRTTPEIQKEIPVGPCGPLEFRTGKPSSRWRRGPARRLHKRSRSKAMWLCSPTAIFSESCGRLAGSRSRGRRLFALGTGSVSVLGYERATRVITRWNLTISA